MFKAKYLLKIEGKLLSHLPRRRPFDGKGAPLSCVLLLLQSKGEVDRERILRRLDCSGRRVRQ